MNQCFCDISSVISYVVMVVLPDPLQGMELRRNSTETKQSDHAPRSGPEKYNLF